MAKIVSDIFTGIILQLVEKTSPLGNLPANSVTIELDQDTNSHVIQIIKDDWNNHLVIDNILYHNGQPVVINPPGEYYRAIQSVETEYPTLPDWVKVGTAVQAETYINNQIWNGQTIKQVEAWIDINIADLTIANINQINIRLAAIRQGLKLVAGAVIATRSLFILTAKLLIYIRDLVIRFRSK